MYSTKNANKILKTTYLVIFKLVFIEVIKRNKRGMGGKPNGVQRGDGRGDLVDAEAAMAALVAVVALFAGHGGFGVEVRPPHYPLGGLSCY